MTNEPWGYWRRAVTTLVGAYAGAVFSLATTPEIMRLWSEAPWISILFAIVLTAYGLTTLAVYDSEGHADGVVYSLALNIFAILVTVYLAFRFAEHGLVAHLFTSATLFFGLLAAAQFLEYLVLHTLIPFALRDR
ncbi:hypothetical protein [Magnetospirillum sp. UT-4]|uniref:hypothetical protein n=1 Tax=Magnetospirillum sp. UT-4 TaxID=2681467 RepID=UPI00138113BE|nr:hypothetical protein [Magnetospirillum sp. UT-4]CAA7625679.1 membrane hypothetical protein [Magnetospirillum sp. UT-4]